MTSQELVTIFPKIFARNEMQVDIDNSQGGKSWSSLLLQCLYAFLFYVFQGCKKVINFSALVEGWLLSQNIILKVTYSM